LRDKQHHILVAGHVGVGLGKAGEVPEAIRYLETGRARGKVVIIE